MGDKERQRAAVNLYELPSNPLPEQVIELLSKLPSEMGYIENQLVELKKEANDLKLLIKGKKMAWDLEQSRIRLTYSKHYREKMLQWVNESSDKINELAKNGLTRTEAKEMLKQMKPEKPTKNDLDDFALIRTEALQKEIEDYEQRLLNVENLYEAKKVNYNILDNNFRATISIKGLVQRDMEL